MKTLTVQEASRNLGELVHCAAGGEEITIHDGTCTVLLQPVAAPAKNNSKGREACDNCNRNHGSQPPG